MNKQHFLYAAALVLLAVCFAGCEGTNDLEKSVYQGSLKGRFSVSASEKVSFSKGNLQYQPSTGTWRFAEQQWEYIGGDNRNISPSYTGWIDLFGYGTGNAPVKASENSSDYATFTDWGVNPISNGGNEPNAWRTLSADEWLYLFHERKNAENLFGLGTVNYVFGMIILPDNWKTPSELTFAPSTTKGMAWNGEEYENHKGDNFNHNKYTLEQWQQMEQAGAVFLPSAGYRIGTVTYGTGTSGHYTSSTGVMTLVSCLYFCGIYTIPQSYYKNIYANSVRLVR